MNIDTETENELWLARVYDRVSFQDKQYPQEVHKAIFLGNVRRTHSSRASRGNHAIHSNIVADGVDPSLREIEYTFDFSAANREFFHDSISLVDYIKEWDGIIIEDCGLVQYTPQEFIEIIARDLETGANVSNYL